MNADELAAAVQVSGRRQGRGRRVRGSRADRDVGAGRREVGGATGDAFRPREPDQADDRGGRRTRGDRPGRAARDAARRGAGDRERGRPRWSSSSPTARGSRRHRALYAPLAGAPRADRVDLAAALREAAEARRPDADGPAPGRGFARSTAISVTCSREKPSRGRSESRDAGEAIERLVLEPLGIAGQAGTIRDLALARRRRSVRSDRGRPLAWRGGVGGGARRERVGAHRAAGAPATQGSSARSTRS